MFHVYFVFLFPGFDNHSFNVKCWNVSGECVLYNALTMSRVSEPRTGLFWENFLSTKKCVIFRSKPIHHIDITIGDRISYLYNGIHHTTPYEHWACALFLSVIYCLVHHFIHCILLSSAVFDLRYEANEWRRDDNTYDVFASREYWIQRHRSMVVIMQYTHTTCICTLGQNRLFIVHCAGKFVFRY